LRHGCVPALLCVVLSSPAKGRFPVKGVLSNFSNGFTVSGDNSEVEYGPTTCSTSVIRATGVSKSYRPQRYIHSLQKWQFDCKSRRVCVISRLKVCDYYLKISNGVRKGITVKKSVCYYKLRRLGTCVKEKAQGNNKRL